MNISLGQVVYSKAGRDTGKKFVVVEIVDEVYVLVSDGNLRRIEKPKKKKLKHLEPKEQFIVTVREKLMNMQKVTNSDIRKAMTSINDG